MPISDGGWGSSGIVLRTAMQNYILHSAFPNLIDPDATVNGFHYVMGRHPGSSTSLVSGIGTHTTTNAYGINRADFSLIPGGNVAAARTGEDRPIFDVTQEAFREVVELNLDGTVLPPSPSPKSWPIRSEGASSTSRRWRRQRVQRGVASREDARS